MRVRLTDRARADLIEIGDYIAQDNPVRGKSFVRELHKRCMSLSTNPGRFPIWQGNPVLGLRRLVHGAYLIFYSINSERGLVEIAAVVHGARDLRSVMAGRANQP